MKKKIIFSYEWINEENPSLKIPVHHETKLMGVAEYFIPKERRGRRTSGIITYTFSDNISNTKYKGIWEVEYVYPKTQKADN